MITCIIALSNQVHLQKQEHIFCAALFQSLLFEACGRTVNPVNGDVGLLWTGNWHICQAAIETVLRGGSLRPMPELFGLNVPVPVAVDADSERKVTCTDARKLQDPNPSPSIRFTSSRSGKDSSGWKRKQSEEWVAVGR
ncbi:hypothetical protein HN51_030525 [Arachis hypogaea]|uniref:LOB domain-containing protein n=1 Tax=Arachis hypogaea TaxID=3818 RepID=A0A445BB02_ARAHY|nr:LOB domain-containing protein 38-like [Arachis hypogaea]RYR35831.1 hypothetical protein Ahy_A10g050929 [Arachis hypogaea]